MSHGMSLSESICQVRNLGLCGVFMSGQGLQSRLQFLFQGSGQGVRQSFVAGSGPGPDEGLRHCALIDRTISIADCQCAGVGRRSLEHGHCAPVLLFVCWRGEKAVNHWLAAFDCQNQSCRSVNSAAHRAGFLIGCQALS